MPTVEEMGAMIVRITGTTNVPEMARKIKSELAGMAEESKKAAATAKASVAGIIPSDLRLARNIKSTTQAMAASHGTTRQTTMLTQQLGFAVEDASVSYGTTGIQGAIRGATNNLSMMSMALGPQAALVTTLALSAVNLGMSFAKAGKEAKEAAKDIDTLDKLRLKNIEFRGSEIVATEKHRFAMGEVGSEQETIGAIKAKQQELNDAKAKQLGIEHDIAELQGNASNVAQAQVQAMRAAEKMKQEAIAAEKDSFLDRNLKIQLPGSEAFRKGEDATRMRNAALAQEKEANQQIKGINEDINSKQVERNQLIQQQERLARELVDIQQAQARAAAAELAYQTGKTNAFQQHRQLEEQISQSQRDSHRTIDAARDAQDTTRGVFNPDAISNAVNQARDMAREVDIWRIGFDQSSARLDEINDKIEEAHKAGKDTAALEGQRTQELRFQADLVTDIAAAEKQRTDAIVRSMRERNLSKVGLDIAREGNPEQARLDEIKREAEDRRKAVESSFAAGDINNEQRTSMILGIDIAAFKETNKQVFEDAKRVIEDNLTPMEEFKKKQAELDEMLKIGAIDVNTHTRAMKELEQQVNKKYQADFSPKGLDALRAGTGAALDALESYRAGMRTPINVDDIKQQGNVAGAQGNQKVDDLALAINRLADVVDKLDVTPIEVNAGSIS